MKLQKELGRVKETGVQSAESNYYSVQAQAADLKRQIREMENSLSLLLGQPAQTISRGKLENQSLPSEFWATLLVRRPMARMRAMTTLRMTRNPTALSSTKLIPSEIKG